MDAKTARKILGTPLWGREGRKDRRECLELLTGQKVAIAKAGGDALWSAIFSDLKTTQSCLASMEEEAVKEMKRIALQS